MGTAFPNLENSLSQMELGISRQREADRNAHLGGRSFYFFDFDDNVAFLTTPLVLFHKQTGVELPISSGEFATEHANIGLRGPYKDFQLDYNDETGTFRNFRDHSEAQLKKLGRNSQVFVEDIAMALGQPDFQWKGPSWSCFYHATFNQRPVSVITARGHSPKTIQTGIELFVKAGHLPGKPNYLSIYPVSHPQVKKELGENEKPLSTAELKQAAIRASVLRAIEVYGPSPHHRFGMSDDDPRNIELIREEMSMLKHEFPEMKFFLIETQNGDFIKHEVEKSRSRKASETLAKQEQLALF
jgi:hypothetical protein